MVHGGTDLVDSMAFAFGSGVVVGIMTGEPFSILHSDDFVILYSVVWFV